ncbi:lysophospholipid acyltransferase family protein [Mesorhizobium sp. CAU 1741]|uniref:lysophospholipid acyltransferase family protein n=1 Tax=Mesorhizobium sp. CAU 1741 TaxID=3140366 RepID=UPI00325A8BF1
MIASARLVLALAVAVLATPALALWQVVALRTGRLDPHRAPRAWHRLMARLLGLKITAHGKPAGDRPLLIACNHVSWTDITVLGAIADVHFIAKADVAGWPVMGPLSRLQRTVFVERGARRRSGAQVGEIAARLAEGDAMVLFAEGTTGDGNRVLPFNSTLFGAAVGSGTGVAIQPVAIVYTRLHGIAMGRRHRRHAAWIGDQTLVPHLARLLREGALDVEVHFGEPLAFGPDEGRKDIARAVEARVRAMMEAALRNPA